MSLPTESPTAAKMPAFVLASLMTGYPDESFAKNLEVLLADDAVDSTFQASAGEAWARLRKLLEAVVEKPSLLDDLRSEYIDIFERGRGSNSLYETEYGRARAMVKGGELVDISGFYHAFGLELGSDGFKREMLDHVSVELEFYAILLMKQLALAEREDANGSEIVLDARKKFLMDHLGRFVGSIAERPGVLNSPVYSTVFSCCRDLIRAECNSLGVSPVPADWLAGDSDSGEVTCGSGGGCLKA